MDISSGWTRPRLWRACGSPHTHMTVMHSPSPPPICPMGRHALGFGKHPELNGAPETCSYVYDERPRPWSGPESRRWTWRLPHSPHRNRSQPKCSAGYSAGHDAGHDAGHGAGYGIQGAQCRACNRVWCRVWCTAWHRVWCRAWRRARRRAWCRAWCRYGAGYSTRISFSSVSSSAQRVLLVLVTGELRSFIHPMSITINCRLSAWGLQGQFCAVSQVGWVDEVVPKVS